MKLKHKNVLVYGMSSSGEWASKLLLRLKANVFLYDDNMSVLRSKNIGKCFLVQELNENLIRQFDFIVISPSITQDNPNLVIAKKHNIKIYSEVEFASLFAKKMVAVTGTNGKTTTVQLISAILNKKYKALACGNIGYPLSRAVIEQPKAIKVVEVSSFMLENADLFSPHVATILNIEPDHLVRHKTMAEYTRLKYNIFNNIGMTDYVVINLDDNIHSTKTCYTVTYSMKYIADVYVKNGYIFLHNHKIAGINELKLKGKHNIYNIMCAICFAYIYKVSPKKIREALLNFDLERFRIEYIGKVNDINFINDSKSTNISSTLACVDAVKGAIILLLGGSEKGLDYTQLFSRLSKRVKQIYAFGKIADILLSSGKDHFEIVKCDTLRDAFEKAVKIAKPNDSIVLSPASASYDQYANYVERGKDFNKLVNEYANQSKEK